MPPSRAPDSPFGALVTWQAPTKDIALAHMQSKADLAPKAAMTLMAILERMTSFPHEIVRLQTRRGLTSCFSTMGK